MGTSIALQLARRGAGKIVLLEKHEIASERLTVERHRACTMHTRRWRVWHCARARFTSSLMTIGGECGFRRTGFIAMAGVADVETLKANVAMHRRIGIDARVLMPDDLAELEPRLMHAGVGAAAWEPDSGHADGHTTTASYAAAARRQGVEILTGVNVHRILTDAQGIVAVETSGGSIAVRTLVVAAGYRTRELLAPLGVDIPITPVRHAIAIVQRSAGLARMHPTISDRVLGSYYGPEGAELTLIRYDRAL